MTVFKNIHSDDQNVARALKIITNSFCCYKELLKKQSVQTSLYDFSSGSNTLTRQLEEL